MSPREIYHLLLFFPRTNWTMKIISAYTPQHAVVGVSIDPFGIDFSKQRIRRVRERDSATNASLCDKSFNEQSHSRCTVLAKASRGSPTTLHTFILAIRMTYSEEHHIVT